MPEQINVLDVWIVESNTVYRQVPFTVIGNWIQQGRILGEDRVRPAGAADWKQLDEMPLLTPYLPRPSPLEAEDRAEAEEKVELDTHFRPRTSVEETEVDMIPLIDVSLVLLIFFMMTASGMMAASIWDTPAAKHGGVMNARGIKTIGVTHPEGGQIEFFSDDEPQTPKSLEDLVQHVVAKTRGSARASEIIIKADPKIPYEVMQKLQMQLQINGITNVKAGIKEIGGEAPQ